MNAIVDNDQVAWPSKRSLFGLNVSCVEYDEAVRCIVESAKAGKSAVVSCHAVHAIITISSDPQLRDTANQFSMITPDGQPVRWALNLLYGTELRERVYGPELMLRVLQAAASQGLKVYLCGGASETLQALGDKLPQRIPGLQIVGHCSPPFRKLDDQDFSQIAQQVNQSAADIVFIGLGCPKQDWFAGRLAPRISAVQICVGAAFDFHAGVKPMAPAWMQRMGLEWLFRFACEPRRLWRRYLVTNSQFCWRLAKSLRARRGVEFGTNDIT